MQMPSICVAFANISCSSTDASLQTSDASTATFCHQPNCSTATAFRGPRLQTTDSARADMAAVFSGCTVMVENRIVNVDSLTEAEAEKLFETGFSICL